MKPGMTASSAGAELKGLAANLEKAFPIEQKDQTFQVAAGVPVQRQRFAAGRWSTVPDCSAFVRHGGGSAAGGLS